MSFLWMSPGQHGAVAMQVDAAGYEPAEPGEQGQVFE